MPSFNITQKDLNRVSAYVNNLSNRLSIPKLHSRGSMISLVSITPEKLHNSPITSTLKQFDVTNLISGKGLITESERLKNKKKLNH